MSLLSSTESRRRTRTAAAGAAVAGVVAGILLAGTATSANAAEGEPPFNQDGLSASFQVGCYFTTDERGVPLSVSDDAGSHPADVTNADDRAYLMSHTPSFFQDAVDQTAGTYPFAVDVDVQAGTADYPLPENPLPGNIYAGPFDSQLDLVLPTSVAHVIRESAGLDGLIGNIEANAFLTTEAASGPVNSPFDSDPFMLGTADNPVVPVDEIAPIAIKTTALWRNVAVPADWNTTTATVNFGGYDAVSVAVQVVDQADPSTSRYQLNLLCSPVGSDVVEIGSVDGNWAGTPASVTTETLPDGVLGVAYSNSVATAGTPTVTTKVTQGKLPDGLTLAEATGEISGTPTTAGVFTFTVQASNQYGTGEQAYTVTINEAPTIVTKQLNSAQVGTDYSQPIEATGSPTIRFAVTDGALPDGLTLDSSTGVISGTPKVAGQSTFTITATNAYGTVARAYTLKTGKANAVVPPTQKEPETTKPQSGSAKLATTGGSAPVWMLTVGGISLAAGGTLFALRRGLSRI